MPTEKLLGKKYLTGVCPRCLQTVSFDAYSVHGGGVGEIGSQQLFSVLLDCPKCGHKTNRGGKLFLAYNKIYNVPSIYTIHVMEKLGSPHYGRTFGWYPYEEWAKRAVKNNECDIHECSYLYAVIEEFEYGVFPLRKREWWYKWNGKKYISIDKPKKEKRIVNYGMG